MNNERIEVIIGKDGSIETKTLGIKGKVCDNVIQKILVGAGAVDVKTQHTSEFFEDGDNPVEIFSK